MEPYEKVIANILKIREENKLRRTFCKECKINKKQTGSSRCKSCSVAYFLAQEKK